MPRVEKTKAYDQLYLQSLRRVKLQALAKRHNIKANAKTEVIIAKLLETNVVEEQPVTVPTSALRATMAGACEPHIEVAHMFDPSQPPLVYTPRASASGISKAKGPAISAKRSVYHNSTPYPARWPRSSSESFASESSISSEKDIQEIKPEVVRQMEATAFPMKQTDLDVRIVRRHLTKLVNEQAVLKKQIQDVDDLLAYSEKETKGCVEGLNHIKWRREAIEQTVMKEMKSDRHLWDGTANLSSEAAVKWGNFVAKSWNGPLTLRAPYPVDIEGEESQDDEEDEEEQES